MIALLVWLAQTLAGPVATVSASPYPELKPAAVLARYAAALHGVKEPQALTFDYTLEQTGPRTVSQTHRVYRSGASERDETLTVDGKRLNPPKVRIFRGRRNRYTVSLLAPRTADYDFAYVGPRKNGHHVDYMFRLTPKTFRPFNVTAVTIDGVRFLPLAIDFATALNEGAGNISFGSNTTWWVPYFVTARASVADDLATERLTFYTYRFPATLPPSTFGQPRRAPALAPEIPPATLSAPALRAPAVPAPAPAPATTASGKAPPSTLRRNSGRSAEGAPRRQGSPTLRQPRSSPYTDRVPPTLPPSTFTRQPPARAATAPQPAKNGDRRAPVSRLGRPSCEPRFESICRIA